MKDIITQERILLLHPAFIPKITGFVDELEAHTGFIWRAVQAGRTWVEQATIYAQGRTAPGEIVTYSPPGYSWHNYMLAIDAAPIIDGVVNWGFDYKKLQPIAVNHGLEMGLFFPHPDPDHFQCRFGLDIKDAYHKYIIKDFLPNTMFINLS